MAPPIQYCDRHLLEQMRRRTLAVLAPRSAAGALAAYAAIPDRLAEGRTGSAHLPAGDAA